MATKKRRLTDLYVLGKTVTFEEAGESISVWIQKMNPVDNETAIRRANAERARALAAQKDPTGDLYATAKTEIEDYVATPDALIDYVTSDEVARVYASREAELAAEEKWSKDDYLQGLRDAWEEGLAQDYAKNKEHVEAARVYAELEKFAQEAEELAKTEIADIKEAHRELPEDVLMERAVQKYLQVQADIAWMTEYRKCEVWLSVRDPDNKREKYFESRDELDQLQGPVYIRLVQEIANLSVDPEEGKD